MCILQTKSEEDLENQTACFFITKVCRKHASYTFVKPHKSVESKLYIGTYDFKCNKCLYAVSSEKNTSECKNFELHIDQIQNFPKSLHKINP